MEKETLNSTQTARLLNVRIDYLTMLLRSGVISATKQDGQWAIDRSSVEAYRKRQNYRRLVSEQTEQEREKRQSRERRVSNTEVAAATA